jgi:hypothetical protein
VFLLNRAENAKPNAAVRMTQPALIIRGFLLGSFSIYLATNICGMRYPKFLVVLTRPISKGELVSVLTYVGRTVLASRKAPPVLKPAPSKIKAILFLIPIFRLYSSNCCFSSTSGLTADNGITPGE